MQVTYSEGEASACSVDAQDGNPHIRILLKLVHQLPTGLSRRGTIYPDELHLLSAAVMSLTLLELQANKTCNRDTSDMLCQLFQRHLGNGN